MSFLWPLISAAIALAAGVASNWIPKPAKVPVIVVVVILALLAAVGIVAAARSGDNSVGGPPTSYTSPVPTSAHASFSSPLPNSEVKVGKSIRVTGTASGLAPDEKIWVIASAGTDVAARYLMNSGPVLTQDGLWDFPSGGLGTSSDIGYSIRLHAILASEPCNAKLDAEVARQGPALQGSFLLPDECRELTVVTLNAVA